jgi:transcriptional regulator with XRE-family HTH domain
MMAARMNGSVSPGNGHDTGGSHSNGQQHPSSSQPGFYHPASSQMAQLGHFLPAPSTSDQTDAFLGREIRGLRRDHGWTQKYLAGMVGITGAQLHRYEVGSTRVSSKRLLALSQALGVSPDRLVTSHPAMPRAVAAPTAHMESGDDLLALIDVFSQISDPKNRKAVVAIARILAAPRSTPVEEE